MRNLVGLLIRLEVAVTTLGAVGVGSDIASVSVVEPFTLLNTAEAAGTVVGEVEVCSWKAHNEAADDVPKVRSDQGPRACFSKRRRNRNRSCDELPDVFCYRQLLRA